MRPRPLCTRTYLKDVSEAFRQQQQPDNNRKLSEQFHRLARLALLAIALWGICWVISSGWGYMIDHAITVGPLTAPIPEELLEARADRLYSVGQSYIETLPDGSKTRVRYMGKWNQTMSITPQPGDEWYYRGHLWVWLDRGGRFAWIDP